MECILSLDKTTTNDTEKNMTNKLNEFHEFDKVKLKHLNLSQQLS